MVIESSVAEKYRKLADQDQFIFDEIFVHNAYQATELEIKGRVVIDVGANVGMFSLFAKECGASKVYALEPDEANFDILLKNLAEYDPDGVVQPMKKAVHSEGGKPFSTNNRGGESKALIGAGSLHTVSIPELLCFFSEQSDAVLKLDCEGAEYPIIYKTEGLELRRFEHLYMEIHVLEPDYDCVGRLVDHIQTKGFELNHVTTFNAYGPGGKPFVHPNKIYKFRRIPAR